MPLRSRRIAAGLLAAALLLLAGCGMEMPGIRQIDEYMVPDAVPERPASGKLDGRLEERVFVDNGDDGAASDPGRDIAYDPVPDAAEDPVPDVAGEPDGDEPPWMEEWREDMEAFRDRVELPEKHMDASALFPDRMRRGFARVAVHCYAGRHYDLVFGGNVRWNDGIAHLDGEVLLLGRTGKGAVEYGIEMWEDMGGGPSYMRSRGMDGADGGWLDASAWPYPGAADLARLAYGAGAALEGLGVTVYGDSYNGYTFSEMPGSYNRLDGAGRVLAPVRPEAAERISGCSMLTVSLAEGVEEAEWLNLEYSLENGMSASCSIVFDDPGLHGAIAGIPLDAAAASGRTGSAWMPERGLDPVVALAGIGAMACDPLGSFSVREDGDAVVGTYSSSGDGWSGTVDIWRSGGTDPSAADAAAFRDAFVGRADTGFRTVAAEDDYWIWSETTDEGWHVAIVQHDGTSVRGAELRTEGGDLEGALALLYAMLWRSGSGFAAAG